MGHRALLNRLWASATITIRTRSSFFLVLFVLLNLLAGSKTGLANDHDHRGAPCSSEQHGRQGDRTGLAQASPEGPYQSPHHFAGVIYRLGTSDCISVVEGEAAIKQPSFRQHGPQDTAVDLRSVQDQSQGHTELLWQLWSALVSTNLLRGVPGRVEASRRWPEQLEAATAAATIAAPWDTQRRATDGGTRWRGPETHAQGGRQGQAARISRPIGGSCSTGSNSCGAATRDRANSPAQVARGRPNGPSTRSCQPSPDKIAASCRQRFNALWGRHRHRTPRDSLVPCISRRPSRARPEKT